MNKGTELYNKAKKIIPGGNQFLSKRPEMFLPDKWPSYYSKASGCQLWDLNNNKYIDMSIMGIGACSLGYANPEVNNAVKKAIDNGSISTLNSYEEVELAEKLIDLHPYMEMVRFARTGGEANAIAIRIARAVSRKSKVAICGYHGSHDWYLSANLNGKNNLEGLLLSGLDPAGVPKELEGTTLPFHYGKIDELQMLVDKYDDIGVICIEVQRGEKADLPFLNEVRVIANQINAVLIFDEISSGFRLSVGAIYKLYNLEPDMVILGKALGNGFGISAILGKRDVMEAAQDCFISSSYWTERTGFAAALETIRQFEENDVIDYLKMIGEYFRTKLEPVFTKHNIQISGKLTVPIMTYNIENPLLMKTVLTQEMMERGFLSSNIIYFSNKHTKNHIDYFCENMGELLEELNTESLSGLSAKLTGEICHSGFNRLT